MTRPLIAPTLAETPVAIGCRTASILALRGWTVRQICSSHRCSHFTVQNASEALMAQNIRLRAKGCGVADREGSVVRGHYSTATRPLLSVRAGSSAATCCFASFVAQHVESAERTARRTHGIRLRCTVPAVTRYPPEEGVRKFVCEALI